MTSSRSVFVAIGVLAAVLLPRLPIESDPPVRPVAELGEVPSQLDQPSLVLLDETRVLLAYVQYEPGQGDRLFACEVSLSGKGEPQPVQPQFGEILRPSGCLNTAGEPQLFWTELIDGRAQLLTSWRRDGRWSPPRKLATGDGPSFNAECLRATDGTVWLVWQQYLAASTDGAMQRTGGSLEIQLAAVDGVELKPMMCISDSSFSDWDPVLCERAGELWVAWVQYSGRDYEIVARHLHLESKELSATLNLSQDPQADDIHPSLCSDPASGLWLAWDAVSDPLRGASLEKRRDNLKRSEIATLRMLCLRDGELHTALGNEKRPRVVAPKALLNWSGGFPQITFDPQSGIQLTHRYHVKENGSFAFAVATRSYAGAEWSPPQSIPESHGSASPCSVVSSAAGLWVAWHQDRQLKKSPRSKSWSEAEQQALEARGIFLTGTLGPHQIGTAFRPAAAQKSAALQTQPLATTDLEPRSHPLAQLDSNPFVAGTDHYRVASGETTYRVYWGDLHRHSCVSRCTNGLEPNPGDRYAFGRDVHLYDFYALTDHSGQLDDVQWWRLGKWIDLYQTPGFCTLQGYEWSTLSYGHQNVILKDRLDHIVSPFHPSGTSPKELWQLLPPGSAITIPHHSAHERFPTAWSKYDPNFLRLVEIYQARRGSFEFEGCFRQARSAASQGRFIQDALNQGLEFGIIASTDHGNGASYAAVLAERLDRESLFEALYARRTYGSTTKGILLDFRINDALMGSSISCKERPTLSLKVQTVTEISEVVVFRNGEVARVEGRKVVDGEVVGEPGKIRKQGLGGFQWQDTWVDSSAPPGKSWYYARVLQKDGEIAWSSPIFVQRPERRRGGRNRDR